MGNRPPSRQREKQKQKAPAVAAAPAAAAPPVDALTPVAPGVGQQEHQQDVEKEGAASPRGSGKASSPTKHQQSEPQLQQQEPNEREGDDALDNNQAEAEVVEEDPLRFFRRLSSLSNGESAIERESQDLFMSYTQALLFKEAGDYAAARCVALRYDAVAVTHASVRE